uniref:Uncharacterized protein n=1 Tax=Pristionchus pacificus TaxID=54126 RepID=A0A2A6CVR4_PRIPA|eukprot:PDM82324.1 hypothetical protein PRIPAC_36717 [Pristionchus pacificus]
MVPPWVEKEEEGRVIYLHLCTLAEMTKHKGSKHYVRASVELGATIVVKCNFMVESGNEKIGLRGSSKDQCVNGHLV